MILKKYIHDRYRMLDGTEVSLLFLASKKAVFHFCFLEVVLFFFKGSKDVQATHRGAGDLRSFGSGAQQHHPERWHQCMWQGLAMAGGSRGFGRGFWEGFQRWKTRKTDLFWGDSLDLWALTCFAFQKGLVLKNGVTMYLAFFPHSHNPACGRDL